MEAYSAVKLLHVTCALLSISGFIYRFVLLKQRVDLKAKFTTKVLPHIIDTVLLAKIVLLVAYIGFGMKALKPGIDDEVRRKAFNAACICIFLILCFAFEHLFRVNKGDLLSNGAQKATVVEEYDHSQGTE